MICTDTQTTAQWWEQLLNATGGKLELQKCFYYPIIWKFDAEGVPNLETPNDDSGIIIISSETGKQEVIWKKSPMESHKTLGIMENPSGDYQDEYNHLKQISEKWRTNISNQYMNRQESWLFYTSFYLPSLRYHLTVGTYTNAQLERIQHPLVQLILPRIGYNSNMPKEVIYGPTLSGGMGFVPLFIVQATQKLKHIMQAYRRNTPLKKILHVTFEWSQKIMGTTNTLFMKPHIPVPSLQVEQWITTLRDFLSKSNLKLRIPELEGVHIQRYNDQALMDIALNDKNWSNQDLLCINRCRIYLHVETIADITNAYGTELLSSSYFCMEEGRVTDNTLWPYQPRPEPHHRTKWQKFLDYLCHAPTLQLKQPLGIWYKQPLHRWTAYYDPQLQSVMILDQNEWQHYTTVNKYRRHWIIPRNQVSIDTTHPSQILQCQPMDLLRSTSTYYKVTPHFFNCLLYTSPSPRDGATSRMPSSA